MASEIQRGLRSNINFQGKRWGLPPDSQLDDSYQTRRHPTLCSGMGALIEAHQPCIVETGIPLGRA